MPLLFFLYEVKQTTTTPKICCLFSSHVVFLQTLPKLDRSILSVPVCACVPNLDLYNGNTISEINSNIFAIGVVGKQLPSQSKVVTMCFEFLSCRVIHETQLIEIMFFLQKLMNAKVQSHFIKVSWLWSWGSTFVL